MVTITNYMQVLGKNAKLASQILMKTSAAQKNKALQIIAEKLCLAKEKIKQANQKDLVNGAKNGLSSALLDRLALTDIRLESMGIMRIYAKIEVQNRANMQKQA